MSIQIFTGEKVDLYVKQGDLLEAKSCTVCKQLFRLSSVVLTSCVMLNHYHNTTYNRFKLEDLKDVLTNFYHIITITITFDKWHIV